MSLRTKIIQTLIGFNEALIFYPRLRKFYRSHLKMASPTIVDVGANKGQSISFFRGIYPDATIYAFEPNRKLYSRLKARYSGNNRISVSSLGVSSQPGKLVFRENVLDETSTFEELNYDSGYLHKKAKVLGVPVNRLIVAEYEVEVTTLTDFTKNLAKRIDVLKIDVEGHELQCLRGLFLNSQHADVRFIQVESHHDDMYANSGAGEVAGLLAENGFTEKCRIRHGFGDFFEVIYENTRI